MKHVYAAMSKNLQHILAQTPEERKEKAITGGLLLGVGGAQAGSLALLNKAMDTFKDPELAGAILKKQLEENPTLKHIKPIFEPHAAGFSIEGPKSVILGEKALQSPGIVSHELGHAAIDRNRLGRLLQNKYTLAAGSNSPIIGLLSGALSGFSDNEKIQRLGRLAPILAAIPQVLYEGGASIQGLRALHGTGATKGQLLRAAATQLPGFATYLANPAMGYLGAKLTQKSIQHARKVYQASKEDENK